jgi:hypothetical protein
MWFKFSLFMFNIIYVESVSVCQILIVALFCRIAQLLLCSMAAKLGPVLVAQPGYYASCSAEKY